MLYFYVFFLQVIRYIDYIMNNFLKLKCITKTQWTARAILKTIIVKDQHLNDCIVIMQQPKLKLQCVNASILQKRI